jgi:hypothetical protein
MEAPALLEKQADPLFCTCDKAALIVLWFISIENISVNEATVDVHHQALAGSIGR